jgi:hypothetical protein
MEITLLRLKLSGKWIQYRFVWIGFPNAWIEHCIELITLRFAWIEILFYTDQSTLLFLFSSLENPFYIEQLNKFLKL